jgi:hypothetical protein
MKLPFGVIVERKLPYFYPFSLHETEALVFFTVMSELSQDVSSLRSRRPASSTRSSYSTRSTKSDGTVCVGHPRRHCLRSLTLLKITASKTTTQVPSFPLFVLLVSNPFLLPLLPPTTTSFVKLPKTGWHPDGSLSSSLHRYGEQHRHHRGGAV